MSPLRRHVYEDPVRNAFHHTQGNQSLANTAAKRPHPLHITTRTARAPTESGTSCAPRVFVGTSPHARAITARTRVSAGQPMGGVNRYTLQKYLLRILTEIATTRTVSTEVCLKLIHARFPIGATVPAIPIERRPLLGPLKEIRIEVQDFVRLLRLRVSVVSFSVVFRFQCATHVLGALDCREF